MAIETQVARRLFTREEYHRMAEVGILRETDRLELIRGEIVEMSPIGPRHYAFVSNAMRLLVTRLSDRAFVGVQGPVVLADDTEPQPDLAVNRHRTVPYRERLPLAEDVLLLIEAATSIAHRRAGVPRRHPRLGQHRGRQPSGVPGRDDRARRHLRVALNGRGRVRDPSEV